MSDRLTRRGLLALFAAAGGAALPLAAASPAAAQLSAPPPGPLPVPGGFPGGAGSRPPEGLRISRFAVDASPLRTAFNGVNADLVERDLTHSLKSVFADLSAGPNDRGVALVARIDSLYLPPWAGGRAGGGGDDGPDNIEGVGIVAAGSRVISQTPLYTVLQPSYSGAWYLPDIDQRRISSICYQFAYWLRREMSV